MIFPWFFYGFPYFSRAFPMVLATKGDIDSRRTHAPLAHSEQSLFLGLKPCLV